MNMKILLLGSTGQVGTAIESTCKKGIEQAIDKCEIYPKEAFELNYKGLSEEAIYGEITSF